MGSIAQVCSECKDNDEDKILQIDEILTDARVANRFGKVVQERKKIYRNLIEKNIHLQENSDNGIIYEKNRGVYFGNIRHNKSDGEGTLIFHNLNEYNGSFKEGNFDGQGELKDCSTQSVFRGTFSNGNPQSGQLQQEQFTSISMQNIIKKSSRSFYAQIKFSNGLFYKGEMAANKYPYFVFQGQGTMQFPDKSVYEGQWFRGRMNGKGKYLWENGDFYQGQYRNGQRWGFGQMVWSQPTKKAITNQNNQTEKNIFATPKHEKNEKFPDTTTTKQENKLQDSNKFKQEKLVNNENDQPMVNQQRSYYSYKGYWEKGRPINSIININTQQSVKNGEN